MLIIWVSTIASRYSLRVGGIGYDTWTVSVVVAVAKKIGTWIDIFLRRRRRLIQSLKVVHGTAVPERWIIGQAAGGSAKDWKGMHRVR